MTIKVVGLCYRCEWRAQFHEGKRRPRFQCGEDYAVNSCYMYKPVTPVVLKEDKDDPRPQFGPPIVSSRSDGIRIPDGEIHVHYYDDGAVLYWKPKEETQNVQTCNDREVEV